MEHTRQGGGEPLALIHFQGGHAGVWAPVAERLAATHEVWAVSLPGFGGTPPLAEPPTPAALARAVAGFMASQGHESFHVAGNSLGGIVALALGRLGAARSVCAISPAGFAEGIEALDLHGSLLAHRYVARLLLPWIDRLAHLAAFRRYATLTMAEHAERWPPEYFAALLRSVATSPGYEATRRHALRERFRDGAAITCPVTIAWAEHDRLLLTAPQSRRARIDLPRAVHVKLWDCGHIPCYDDPDQVADVIRTASARTSPPARARTSI